jgi:outer membrane biosynthesis protein TonB
LVLSTLSARAVVQGPLGFTELHLTFENPEGRTLEGRFEITLPEGAAVSRFAMLQSDGWREAEVVERQRARQAYEDFLHRRQDPALLEHEAGNQFSARVFPIPARGRKELKLSYSQELAAKDTPYRLVLSGLPKLGRLEITAISGDEVTQVIHENVKPEKDFEVRQRPRTLASAPGLRSESLAVARVEVPALGQREPRQSLDRVLLLVDTSASRAAGFDKQIELVGSLVAEIKRTTPQAVISVAAFDQTVAKIFSGPIAEFGPVHLDALRTRGPLGASDVEAALRYAKELPSSRLILISDGIVTAGASEQQTVLATLSPQFQRMDVVMVGGIKDEVRMRSLAATVLTQLGTVLDGTVSAVRLVEQLSRPVLRDLAVEVVGASWYWPHTLDGVQPGDSALVYAELNPATQTAQALQIQLTDKAGRAEQSIPVSPTTGPLLERAFVGAVLASLGNELTVLQTKDPQAAANLKAEIIELSTKHRVLCDLTALLVLETEADYARFQLDRRALADILIVGDHGVELLQRSATEQKPKVGTATPVELDTESASRHGSAPVPAPVPVPAPAKGESAGSAALKQLFGRNSALGSDSPGASSEMHGLIESAGGGGGGGTGEGTVGAGGIAEGSVGAGGAGDESVGFGNLGLSGYGSSGGRGARMYGSSGYVTRRLSSRQPVITSGQTVVSGSLDREVIRRVIRRHLNEVQFCYERELMRAPSLAGRLSVTFVIGPTGAVQSSIVQSSTVHNNLVEQCIAGAVRRWMFPAPQGGSVTITYPFVLQSSAGQTPSQEISEPKVPQIPAYTGTMLEVMNGLARGQVTEALRVAKAWRQKDPGDVLALTALGEALKASGNLREAERAFGSIIDLFPSRADLRRYAGARLENTTTDGLRLAVDSYHKAVESRPDHPNSHRLYAYALLKLGKPAEAFAAMQSGVTHRYPSDRFRGVEQILREDLGLIAAAWRKAEPQQAPEIQRQLDAVGVGWAQGPSLRFVLSWETDANDVDFHIHDGKGGHAFYSNMNLPSGGTLYADVTTGYGPECFAILETPTAFPYRLAAHYYSRGPMGYGMGKLQIVQHDGKGGLRFEERPFVVMNDQAYVDLGMINKPL